MPFFLAPGGQKGSTPAAVLLRPLALILLLLLLLLPFSLAGIGLKRCGREPRTRLPEDPRPTSDAHATSDEPRREHNINLHGMPPGCGRLSSPPEKPKRGKVNHRAGSGFSCTPSTLSHLVPLVAACLPSLSPSAPPPTNQRPPQK